MISIKLSEYKKGLTTTPQMRALYAKKVLVQGSYEEIVKYYNNTPAGLKGIYKHTLNYLIRHSYDDLYNSGSDFLKSPIDYVGLMAFVLPFFSKEVNEFIELRDSFEAAYLLGDYKQASSILDSANSISYSLWAATNKIKVADLIGGVDKRLEEYSRILNKDSHPMTSYVCNHAQETASIETSLQTFIDQRYAEVQSTPFTEKWQYDYIVALLFPYKYIEPSEWISYCMKSSIIDVYCNLIDHLCEIIKFGDQDERLLQYLKKIAEVISDVRLQKYISLLDPLSMVVDFDRRQLLNNSIFLSNLLNYSMEHPCDVDVLLKYVSLRAIEGREVGNESGNLREKIMYHLYMVLKGTDTTLHTTKLRMICLSNQTVFAFRHLYNIINDIDSCDISTYGDLYWFFSTGQNALDAKFYSKDSSRCEFLKLIGANPNVIVEKNKALSLDIFECLSIVEGKLEKYRLDLEYMSACNKLPLYTNPLVVSYLFQRYFDEKNYLNGVYLYVDFHLNNPNAHIDVETRKIELCMNRMIDISLNCPLELSIFYYMIKAKSAKIATNVKRFLTSKGVSRPSELTEISDPKIRYLLEYVVDVDVIDLIPLLFDDTKDSIEERIKILQKLQKTQNNKRISNEIDELMSDLVVNDNLKHVDASKIDVDVSLLKKSKLKGVREIFELYNNTNDKLVYTFNEESIAKMFPVDNSETGVNNSGDQRLYNMPYKQYLFMQFYLLIRDAFLLDDIAGLDSYLSSRIRHGTVVNQLRTDLQDHQLTTRKNEEGGYEINTYWAIDNFHIDGETFTKVTEAFLNFTQKVDEQISFLKNQKIQVKTELVNQDKFACFDFSQGNLQKRIYQLYNSEFKSFDSAIDAVIEDLWCYTEECFTEMKSQVSYCTEQIDLGLQQLRTEVETNVSADNPGLTKFRDYITTCRTLLQNDSIIVQNWFQRSKSMGADFTMEVLNRTAIEGLKRVTEVELLVTESIDAKSKLRGRFLGTMYVLLNNIYSNVVNYYKTFSNTATCSTKIFEKDDLLNIEVTNQVSDVDVSRINSDINKYNISRTKAALDHIARTDEKSGFYKMHNIVYGYFNHPDNVFKVDLENLLFKVQIVLNIENIKS